MGTRHHMQVTKTMAEYEMKKNRYQKNEIPSLPIPTPTTEALAPATAATTTTTTTDNGRNESSNKAAKKKKGTKMSLDQWSAELKSKTNMSLGQYDITSSIFPVRLSSLSPSDCVLPHNHLFTGHAGGMGYNVDSG
jgi:hypothetical protein